MDKDDQYFLALGKFIDTFSTAEHNLKFALSETAKLPREVAQALLSGVNVDNAIKNIKRLYETFQTTIPDEITSALNHMSAITNIRNSIVHYGVTIDGAEFVTSTSAHTIPSRITTYRRNLDDLGRMTADLNIISHRFIWMALKDQPNAYPHVVKQIDEIARTPLQYKP